MASSHAGQLGPSDPLRLHGPHAWPGPQMLSRCRLGSACRPPCGLRLRPGWSCRRHSRRRRAPRTASTWASCTPFCSSAPSSRPGWSPPPPPRYPPACEVTPASAAGAQPCSRRHPAVLVQHVGWASTVPSWGTCGRQGWCGAVPNLSGAGRVGTVRLQWLCGGAGAADACVAGPPGSLGPAGTAAPEPQRGGPGTAAAVQPLVLPGVRCQTCPVACAAQSLGGPTWGLALRHAWLEDQLCSAWVPCSVTSGAAELLHTAWPQVAGAPCSAPRPALVVRLCSHQALLAVATGG